MFALRAPGGCSVSSEGAVSRGVGTPAGETAAFVEERQSRPAPLPLVQGERWSFARKRVLGIGVAVP